MTTKLFTVAGTSVKHNATKFRTANDLAFRIKQLTRDQQTEINLVELPQPMTKIDAARYCSTLEQFSSLEAQIAINQLLGEEHAPAVIEETVEEETVNEVVDEPVAIFETKQRNTRVKKSRQLMVV